MIRGSGKPGKLREFSFPEFVSTLTWLIVVAMYVGMAILDASGKLSFFIAL